MKYLEAFEDFSKGYLIKEGRLSIKNDEMNKLNQIVEKIAEMVENGLDMSYKDIFVDSLKFDIPNLTSKAWAKTPTEYVNWAHKGRDVNEYLSNYILQAKKEKDIDVIYNDKINIFTTDDGKGFVRIYLDSSYGMGHHENSQYNDDGTCTALADWTNGKIAIDKKTLEENKKSGNLRELIRTILYHEFIHAKDPSQFYGVDKRYEHGEGKEDKYYGSFKEFLAFTGQFLEALIDKTKKIINSHEFYNSQISSPFLQKTFQSILDFFAKGTELPPYIVWFYSLTLKDFMRFAKGEKLDFTISDELKRTLWHLDRVKKYNSKMWNNFLGDLYSTMQEIVDLVNNKVEEIISDKGLDKQTAITNKFVKIKVSGIGTYKF